MHTGCVRRETVCSGLLPVREVVRFPTFLECPMKKFALRLWRDEAGFVVSTEMVLVATIVVIGLITGLTTIRDQLSTELADIADAISEVDQSYSYGAITAHASSTSGTIFDDVEDFCERTGNLNDQLGENGTQCLIINVTTNSE